MNNVLLITAAAIAITSTAQADVTFVKGTASATYSIIEDYDDFSITDTDFAAAFAMGNYGFQFGGSRMTLTDDSDAISFGASNAHVYRQSANGYKYGVFTNNSGFGFSGYGVEAMFDFGAVDIEVYAGALNAGFMGGDDIGQAGVEVFYDVSESIELSAGYFTIFEIDGGSNSNEFYSLDASYDIPNTNLAATASYRSLYEGSENMYGLGIKWSFGPDQDERLFGTRDFPMYNIMN